MSATRKARREAARRQARLGDQPPPVANAAVALHWSRLRRRLRLVLLTSTLAALIPLRLFREPLAAWLDRYGMAARLALVLVLLSPALLTWLIGLGQLRDLKRSSDF